MLQAKAKFFAEALGIENFAASDGWLASFKKRPNISYKVICGEVATISDGVVREWVTNLSAALSFFLID